MIGVCNHGHDTTPKFTFNGGIFVLPKKYSPLPVLRKGSSSVALGDGVLPGVQGQAGPSWPVRD
jgi:hypothetical protein